MLTEHVKRTTINVSLPEDDENRVKYEYFTQEEWDALQVAKAQNAVPNARAKRIAEVKAQAQAEVDAVISGPELLQAQVRSLELLEIKLENGSWTAEEQAERNALKADLDATRAVRAREKVALNAIDEAGTVEEVEAVVL